MALNSVQDTVLKWNAYLLADARLVDSVAALAQDPSLPVVRRTYALELLTRYVAPGMWVNEDAATSYVQADSSGHPVPTGQLTALISIGSEPGIPGVQPIDLAARNRARAAIYAMSQSEWDPKLRGLATKVYQGLQVLPQ